MVCVSCMIIPVFIWIWFQFILPIIKKVKSYFFVSNCNEEQKQDATLKCPFKLSQTKDETCKKEENDLSNSDIKKIN
jgi:hypothetical protein